MPESADPGSAKEVAAAEKPLCAYWRPTQGEWGHARCRPAIRIAVSLSEARSTNSFTARLTSSGLLAGPMTATLTPVALSLVTKGRAAPRSPTRTSGTAVEEPSIDLVAAPARQGTSAGSRGRGAAVAWWFATVAYIWMPAEGDSS